MVKYYELATDMSNDELTALAEGLKDGSIHPRDAKMKLGYTFVRMYHGVEAADEAENRFKTVFQQNALPDEIEEKVVAAASLENGQIRLIKLLVDLELQASNGEARRSIQQGAVKINQVKVDDVNADITLTDGDIIQVGKRKFARVTLS
jgi:tyrosyl-tRNA synthetase